MTTVTARELVDVDVTAIAIVKRAASRSPFKILKTDDDKGNAPMNLALSLRLPNFLKADAKAPAVVAVIVKKADDMSAFEARLTAAGFATDKVVKGETENGVETAVYLQGVDTLPDKNIAYLDHGDGTVSVVAHVKKMFSSYNPMGTVFAEVLATEMLFPSMDVALGALRLTLINCLDTAYTGPDAAGKIGQAFDDAKAYFTAMVGSVPVKAFKLDSSPDAATPALTTTPSPVAAPTGDDPQASGSVVEGAATVVKSDDSKNGDPTPSVPATAPATAAVTAATNEGGEGGETKVVKAETPTAAEGAPAADAVQPVKATTTTDEDAQTKLLKSIGDVVAAALAPVNDKLTAVSGSVTALTSKVGEVEALAKSADATVKAAVGGEPAADATQKVTKSDTMRDGSRIPFLDTAYGAPQ